MFPSKSTSKNGDPKNRPYVQITFHIDWFALIVCTNFLSEKIEQAIEEELEDTFSHFLNTICVINGSYSCSNLIFINSQAMRQSQVYQLIQCQMLNQPCQSLYLLNLTIAQKLVCERIVFFKSVIKISCFGL